MYHSIINTNYVNHLSCLAHATQSQDTQYNPIILRIVMRGIDTRISMKQLICVSMHRRCIRIRQHTPLPLPLQSILVEFINRYNMH